jgi:nicotinate dehydrogenase subunit A
MANPISLTVNGRTHSLSVDPDTPLLYVLRNDLQLNAPKFGCGLAQCGACSVIVDKEATRSCVTPVSAVEGRQIVTLEGLGTVEKPHPLQTAFLEERGLQCGYCTNGMIINAKVLLDQKPKPTESEIREHMEPILCRCGAQARIVKAIQRAAG